MKQGARKLVIAAAAFGALLTGRTAAAAEAARSPLVIYLSDQSGTDPLLLRQAQAQADRIFKDSGVQLVWLNLEDVAYQPSCHAFSVLVTFLSQTMVERLSTQETSAKALGSASTAAGRAFIHPDRIRDLAARTRATAGDLAGRVLAHEIGHLLLPVGHASYGIMSEGMETDPTASARFTVLQTRSLQSFLDSRPPAPAEGVTCGAQRQAAGRP